MSRYEFRWNAWNLDHVAEHDVDPEEAEYVVEQPAPGYPEKIGTASIASADKRSWDDISM